MNGEAEEGLFQQVLLELAALEKGDTASALRRILRLDADTLSIERVNFWRMQASPLRIVCEQAYERSSSRYDSGAVLQEADYPRYFRALQEEQMIAAED